MLPTITVLFRLGGGAKGVAVAGLDGGWGLFGGGPIWELSLGDVLDWFEALGRG